MEAGDEEVAVNEADSQRIRNLNMSDQSLKDANLEAQIPHKFTCDEIAVQPRLQTARLSLACGKCRCGTRASHKSVTAAKSSLDFKVHVAPVSR